MINMLQTENAGIQANAWAGTLTSYDQEHCKSWPENNSFRLTRTANKTYDGSEASRVMWGGLVIRNTNNVLGYQNGHTYIALMDVKGKSSNSLNDIYINNNCGWGGTAYGLGNNPANVEIRYLPENFNSNIPYTIYYKWTIPTDDALWKVCKESYSNFQAGSSYFTYQDLKFGFTYQSTGSMGTNLYINNLRMYDLTNIGSSLINISKNGNINLECLRELSGITRFTKYGDIITNNIIEN